MLNSSFYTRFGMFFLGVGGSEVQVG